MSKRTGKKFPFFWFFYGLYSFLLIGVIAFGLFELWKFLDVYEETRPVHAMQEQLAVFDRSQEEQLRTYLTNTVDNPYEDVSVILNSFYERISGQELSFGKLSGAYSELHPVYAVLAGEEHVATVSFAMQDTPVAYNLSGWELEAVTILDTPTYSFAVTIPSSMQLFINKKAVQERSFVSETKTDTPVSYFAYADSGFYEEPVLEVFDRYGTPVTLTKDEETGGYYYRLAYASVPSDVTTRFGDRVLSEEHLLEGQIPVEELSFLPEIEKRFSEYADLSEQLDIPYIDRYYIDFAYSPEEVACTSRLGDPVDLEFDAVMNSYSSALVSNDTILEECRAFAYEFVEKYALFCLRDADKEVMKPYFPENSEYYKLISSMDTRWANKHSKTSFQNHEVKEFFAYSDNLVYINVAIEERLLLSATGKYVSYHIDTPLWIVKLNGQWYVMRIIYTENGA